MANSLSGWYTFAPDTKIRSSEVNANELALKTAAPLWQKYTIPYTSFSGLGATISSNVLICSIGAAEIIDAFVLKTSTLFTGTSITAAVMRIGKTGADAQYTDDFDVKQATGSSVKQITNAIACEQSSTSLILTLSLTGGLLSQLSQGSVDVWIRRAEIP